MSYSWSSVAYERQARQQGWDPAIGERAKAELADGVSPHVCAARILRALAQGKPPAEEELIAILTGVYAFYKGLRLELLIERQAVTELARDAVWMAEDDLADQLKELVRPLDPTD